VAKCRVGVLGVTFKENCPDIRNSKVVDIVGELRSWGVEVVLTDPHADAQELHEEYGLSLGTIDPAHQVDALVVAVAHSEFRAMTSQQLRGLVRSEHPVLIDVKSLYKRADLEAAGFHVWRL
jgi:UDP-N-acetyl-D-galactosamine dehydrogenase